MKLMTLGVTGEVIEEMQRRRPIDVVVLLPNAPPNSQKGPFSCTTEFVQFETRAKVDFRAAATLRQAIRRHRPDIVHAFWSKYLANTVLATVNLPSPPKVISFRGTANCPSVFDPGEWISFLHGRVAAHACESEACRDALVARGVDAARCQVVYNHVAPSYARSTRDVLAQFEIPRDAFVVATVANMRPVKGCDILLEAARLCTDLKNVYWLLIGNVRDARISRLAKLPELRTRVRLAGFRADARELVSIADLFVMPSRSEGLCYALLEAMTQGVCPVVSDAGGMKEVVRHRQDGLVFPRENAMALAATIRELYADQMQRERYAASAQQRATTEFSARRMAERTLALYDQTLACPTNTDHWLPLRALGKQLSSLFGNCASENR